MPFSPLALLLAQQFAHLRVFHDEPHGLAILRAAAARHAQRAGVAGTKRALRGGMLTHGDGAPSSDEWVDSDDFFALRANADTGDAAADELLEMPDVGLAVGGQFFEGAAL